MKIKNIATVLPCAVFILFFSVWCFLGNTPEYSESERRMLAKFPETSWESISTGKFAKDFEEYSTDRFPARDFFRSIKAYSKLGLFMQSDNNGIYTSQGHISKLEYPMNTEMLDYSISLFSKVHEKYFDESEVYVAVIPDKNKDLAKLSMDYDAFEQYVHEGMDFATPISISHMLTPDDYYSTDTHWRQEQITDVAATLARSMGTSISQDYEKNTLTSPFYGVYVGQSALVCEPDYITYLTNDVIDGLQVEGASAVYDIKKAESRDPYEMFLSGNQPVVNIKNPKNPDGKRLIIFRDSFGSSIAPLLAEGYSEIVLVDLRYINSEILGEYVDFENADVLFLYSTILLNNSRAMK